MPTWTELQEYVRNKYVLDDDEESFFSLVFSMDSGRTQKIRVRSFQAFDEDWIEFRSVVCKGSEMPHTIALRKNAEFAIGALALDSDDDFVLVHNAPLSTMDPAEFERPLHVIAGTADSLEKDYSAGNDDW